MSMDLSRRDFLKLAGVGLTGSALTLLAGCNDEDSSGNQSSATEEVRKYQRKSVSMACGSSCTELGFRTPHSDYKVNWNPLVYQTLVEFTGTDYEGKLMKNYTVVDDYHWDVEIYDYITDSEGRNITAEDVVFSFNTYIGLGYATYNTNLIEKIEAVDDYVIRFTWMQLIDQIGELEQPWYHTVIYNQETYESRNFSTDPVATGPYVVEDFVSGSSLTIKAREDYWQTDADKILWCDIQNVEEITIKFITESSQRVIALMTGEVDLVQNMDETSATEFKEGGKYADDFTVEYLLDKVIYCLIPNCGKGIVADKNFRLALFYCIDNNAVATAAGNAIALSIASSYYYKDYITDWENRDNYNTVFDADLAKEYLAKTNYSGEHLTMVTLTGSTYEAITQVVQICAQNIGINLDIQPYDSALIQEYLNDQTSWDIYAGRFGNAALCVKGVGIALNQNTQYGGNACIGLKDDHLQELLDYAKTPEGHTDENVDALYSYAIDNAYLYGVISLNAPCVHTKWLTKIVKNGNNDIMLNACEYEQE